MLLSSKKIDGDFSEFKKVKKLYKEAFPRRERMKFRVLQKSAVSPLVEWLAYYDGEELVGFTYLVSDGALAYLFYFAVCSSKRSLGYGGKILSDLKARRNGETLVLDIEACGEPAKNSEQRLRRRAFYMRNGFTPAGFEATYRGVRYDAMKFGGECGKQRLMQLFKQYRREVLGKNK